jgi:hypothetical protein
LNAQSFIGLWIFGFLCRIIDPFGTTYVLYSSNFNGLFLIYIINEPLLNRDRSAEGGIHLENLDKLFSEENLTSLKKRISDVSDPQTRIIFLVPGTLKKMYRERLAFHLNIELTKDNYVRWKDFRLLEGERISCL